MSFSRVKPLGWAVGELLTSAQMNALDEDHSNAVDGAAGGVYASSAAVDLDNLAGRVRAGSAIDIDATGLLSVLASGTQQVQSGGIWQLLDGSVATFATPLQPGVKGRVRWFLVGLTDANVNLGPEDGTLFYMGAGILSGTKTISIQDTGASAGDWILIVNWDTTNFLDISVPTTGVIASLRTATGNTHAIFLVRFGSLWEVAVAIVVP